MTDKRDYDPQVGYDVKITRVGWYALYAAGTEWKVDVRRLSDDETITRTFEWRWTARRFARSTRRIGNAFARQAETREAEVETFRLGWPDAR